MIRKSCSILRANSGSATIEAAVALPAFVALVIGILQLGMGLIANAGVRQAVEVGARYATIFDTSTNATPTDAQVIAKVRATVYGLPSAQLVVPTPVRGTDATNGQTYVEVSASYPYTFNLFGITGTAMTLRYTRRAYLMPT
jgi:Flp pilus assembly protein TadG